MDDVIFVIYERGAIGFMKYSISFVFYYLCRNDNRKGREMI